MSALKPGSAKGNDSGATAIEYALIASAVALAIALPLVTLGEGLGSTYETIGSYLSF